MENACSNRGTINGREYVVNGRIGQAHRDLPPGANRPKEAHYTAPHPDPKLRKLGWRVAVIFLSLLGVFLCALPGVLKALE